MQYRYDQLIQLKDSGEYVEVYRDGLSDSPLFGRFLQFYEDSFPASSSFVSLRIFDNEFEYCGMSLIRYEDITRLRWGHLSSETIKMLREKEEQLPEAPDFDLIAIYPLIGKLGNEYFKQEYFRIVRLYFELGDRKVEISGEVMSAYSDPLVIKEVDPNDGRSRGTWFIGDARREFTVTRIDLKK